MTKLMEKHHITLVTKEGCLYEITSEELNKIKTLSSVKLYKVAKDIPLLNYVYGEEYVKQYYDFSKYDYYSVTEEYKSYCLGYTVRIKKD